jgi:O-antigen/teichoic acid export membrane protein
MAKFKVLDRISPTSWVTLQTIFVQVFGFALFAVQAPLLGPRAFGLVSIVMVFVGFVEYVMGEVAQDTLISIREISAEHFETMTTVCVCISLACGAALFLSAGMISRWFDEPDLVPICHWMAVVPLFVTLAAAPNAATKRDMQFRPLAQRAIFSVVVGGCVGIALMFMGFGVWALVWQTIVQKAVAAITLWISVPLRFRLGFSARHFADFHRFAVPMLLSRTMSWGASQLPRFVLGLYIGATELGVFSLALRLSDVVVQMFLVPRYAVARVELRRYANDRTGLDAAMHQLIFRYCFLSFPLCVGGAAITPTLFHVWLDPRWYSGIVPAQLMLLICLPYVSIFTIGALLLAFNRQHAEAVASTVQGVTTVLVSLLAAPYGLIAASAAIAARPFVLLPLPLWLAKTQCGISARQILGPQLPILLAAALMGPAVWLLHMQLEGRMPAAWQLPILVGTGGVVYAVAIGLLMPQLLAQSVKRVAAWF